MQGNYRETMQGNYRKTIQGNYTEKPEQNSGWQRDNRRWIRLFFKALLKALVFVVYSVFVVCFLPLLNIRLQIQVASRPLCAVN